jgi:hypothetical protein
MDVVARLKEQWGDGKKYTPRQWRQILKKAHGELMEAEEEEKTCDYAHMDRGYTRDRLAHEEDDVYLAIQEIAYWYEHVTESESEREAGLRRQVQELYDDPTQRRDREQFAYWMTVLDKRPGAHPPFVRSLHALTRAADAVLQLL